MRVCPNCGTPEARGVDDKGRPTVNLSPITGQCVACLVKFAGAKPRPMDAPFDAKQAAAGDRDHEAL